LLHTDKFKKMYRLEWGKNKHPYKKKGSYYCPSAKRQFYKERSNSQTRIDGEELTDESKSKPAKEWYQKGKHKKRWEEVLASRNKGETITGVAKHESLGTLKFLRTKIMDKVVRAGNLVWCKLEK